MALAALAAGLILALTGCVPEGTVQDKRRTTVFP